MCGIQPPFINTFSHIHPVYNIQDISAELLLCVQFVFRWGPYVPSCIRAELISTAPVTPQQIFFFLSCLHFNLIKNVFSRVGFWKGTAQIQSTVKMDMCNFKISFKLKFAAKELNCYLRLNCLLKAPSKNMEESSQKLCCSNHKG